MELTYVRSLDSQQAKQHYAATRYPSARPSRGGANRSSNIKRVINESTTTVDACDQCGGVTPEVRALTEIWDVCVCHDSTEERPPQAPYSSLPLLGSTNPLPPPLDC